MESFSTCDAARAAGKAPLRQGEPGYLPHLDKDGDGIACEPWRRRS
jgi:Excalibur calcium-binding domain